jgi:hypothetical protein
VQAKRKAHAKLFTFVCCLHTDPSRETKQMQTLLDDQHARHLAKTHVVADIKRQAIKTLVMQIKQKFKETPTWQSEAHTDSGLSAFETDLVSCTFFLAKHKFVLAPSMLRYKLDTQLVQSCFCLLEKVLETYILPAVFS